MLFSLANDLLMAVRCNAQMPGCPIGHPGSGFNTDLAGAVTKVIWILRVPGYWD